MPACAHNSAARASAPDRQPPMPELPHRQVHAARGVPCSGAGETAPNPHPGDTTGAGAVASEAAGQQTPHTTPARTLTTCCTHRFILVVDRDDVLAPALPLRRQQRPAVQQAYHGAFKRAPCCCAVCRTAAAAAGGAAGQLLLLLCCHAHRGPFRQPGLPPACRGVGVEAATAAPSARRCVQRTTLPLVSAAAAGGSVVPSRCC